MNRSAIALSALAIVASATAASAYDTIDARQTYQNARIEAAYRSGQLTHREYRALKAEQQRIAQLERYAKSDGHLSQAERARLTAAQNEASRHIYEESHDNDSRRRWWRRWW